MSMRFDFAEKTHEHGVEVDAHETLGGDFGFLSHEQELV